MGIPVERDEMGVRGKGSCCTDGIVAGTGVPLFVGVAAGADEHATDACSVSDGVGVEWVVDFGVGSSIRGLVRPDGNKHEPVLERRSTRGVGCDLRLGVVVQDKDNARGKVGDPRPSRGFHGLGKRGE